jgi:hypothetical protein
MEGKWEGVVDDEPERIKLALPLQFVPLQPIV